MTPHGAEMRFFDFHVFFFFFFTIIFHGTVKVGVAFLHVLKLYMSRIENPGSDDERNSKQLGETETKNFTKKVVTYCEDCTMY